MIVYNVTVKIDLPVHDEWLKWMTEKHIPDVMATGFFMDNKMFRIMADSEHDGITYAIQYFAENFSKYTDYQENAAPALQKEHTEKFKDRFVAFRTLMRPVTIPSNTPS